MCVSPSLSHWSEQRASVFSVPFPAGHAAPEEPPDVDTADDVAPLPAVLVADALVLAPLLPPPLLPDVPLLARLDDNDPDVPASVRFTPPPASSVLLVVLVHAPRASAARADKASLFMGQTPGAQEGRAALT